MIYLCKADEVPVGAGKRVSMGRFPAIAVFNLEGRFHAVDDRCTHGKASLAHGKLDGDRIVCPLHFGAFSLITGAPVQAPCDTPITVYDLSLVDGALFIAQDALAQPA